MEFKTIIGICLVAFIVAGLAYFYFKNKKK
jgi:hypothetical protein